MSTKKALTQSEKIRRMYLGGMERGPISKKLGIRYQIVWRTLNRGLKGHPIERPVVVETLVVEEVAQ